MTAVLAGARRADSRSITARLKSIALLRFPAGSGVRPAGGGRGLASRGPNERGCPLELQVPLVHGPAVKLPVLEVVLPQPPRRGLGLQGRAVARARGGSPRALD